MDYIISFEGGYYLQQTYNSHKLTNIKFESIGTHHPQLTSNFNDFIPTETNNPNLTHQIESLNLKLSQ